MLFFPLLRYSGSGFVLAHSVAYPLQISSEDDFKKAVGQKRGKLQQLDIA